MALLEQLLQSFADGQINRGRVTLSSRSSRSKAEKSV